MALGVIADILLYAPFVDVYEVPDQIRRELTMDEFFKEGGCFVRPNFDKQIQRLEKLVSDDMRGDDWPLRVDEMIESLKTGRSDYEFLNTWLKNSGNGIFTILGDAGTGKTTFLHYLKWSLEDIHWRILDLKRAIPTIEVVGFQIPLLREDFSSLHGKVLAALIMDIIGLLFEKEENGNYNHTKNRKTIRLLLEQYEDLVADATPLEEYAELYNQLEKIEFHQGERHEDRNYCTSCAKIVAEYFTHRCSALKRNRDAEIAALKCVLTHLLIVLRCLEGKKGKKIVIAFDNIERFIGADEIYNKELTDFLYDIRSISDQQRDRYRDSLNINRFAKKYQFIVSMRNTTVRNHTPAENTDFWAHTIDLSGWFAIDEIIQTKIQWYKKKGIEVSSQTVLNHLEHILEDLGVTQDKTLRGLRPKLDLIFNYNKRSTISFLLAMLDDETPTHHIKSANTFYAMGMYGGATFSCMRFGYRSVVWRCVLDQMRRDALFKEIFAQHPTLVGRVAEINYIWKLLTILHNYAISVGENETGVKNDIGYMPLLNLLRDVYNEQGDFVARFYEDGYAKERERMAHLLFSMNCYDRRNDYWFQLVDIQYNENSAHRIYLTKWTDLLKLFIEAKDSPEKLKIRITTAGKAYLGYIAPSFEFISCMAGKMPLLCCLPTEEELQNSETRDSRCIQIIRDTIKEMKVYIKNCWLQADNPNLLYHRTVGTEGLTYAERLVNSTYGYLTNFSNCVNRLVPVTDKSVEKKKEALIKQIVSEADDIKAFITH